jgi:hypothetical protein
VATGDRGDEAYTTIAWGVGLSLERQHMEVYLNVKAVWIKTACASLPTLGRARIACEGAKRKQAAVVSPSE